MSAEARKTFMEAKGLYGQIELLRDRVRIGRKGLLAEPKGGDKEIPIGQISSVHLKDAGWTTHGHVRFVVGEREAREGRLRASDDDEDTVLFHFWERKSFEAIKRAIERRMEKEWGRQLGHVLWSGEGAPVRPTAPVI